MLKKLTVVGCTAVLVSLLAVGTVQGQGQVRSDRAVYFTFSQPVTLPQVTLPAGKYLFRLADSLVNRTIVQIFSADGSKLHAMLMTLPSQRMDLPNDPEIRFLETAANTPAAISTYWYPGERTGWEFVYPRAQALSLARSSKQAVLTTARETSDEEMRTADLARVSPAGDQMPVAADAETPRAAVSGEAQRGEVATDAPAPATLARGTAAQGPAQSASARAPRTRLPATATATPAILLAGLLALSAAFGLGVWRRART